MAELVNEERVKRFEAMLQSPSLAAMLDLAPDEFEQFVKYVFECAGYGVKYVGDIPFPEGPGVDLDLHGGNEAGKVLARVEVRRYTPPNTISLQQVAAFIGLTHLNGDLPAYMVTTSDFTPAA